MEPIRSPRFRFLALSLALLIPVTFRASASPPHVPSRGRSHQFFHGAGRDAAFGEVKRLASIQERHRGKLLATPEIVGIGITLDRHARRLVFLIVVDESLPAPKIPPSLEGVPIVVERGARLKNVDGSGGCILPCHAEQQAPHIQMGNSTGTDLFCGSCTLGFVACDLESGHVVFVTNAHCAVDEDGCEGSAPLGTRFLHRSLGDAHCDGAGLTDIGPLSGLALPDRGLDNLADAAKVDADGTIMSARIRDIGLPDVNPGAVLPGDLVQKSGRTTGLTFGEVQAVNFNTSSGPYTCDEYFAQFVDQIYVRFCRDFDDCESPFDEFSAFVLGGDSGSALLNTNDPPEIVGLILASDDTGRVGLASPIDRVLSALDLDLNIGKCLCPVETLAGGTPDAADSVALLTRFKIEVLSQSQRGQEYARLFEAFKGEVAVMLLRNPGLAADSLEALERLKPVFRGILDRRKALISRADLRKVERLIVAYATAGKDGLRKALTEFRRDLRDPKTLAQLGVTVAG